MRSMPRSCAPPWRATPILPPPCSSATITAPRIACWQDKATRPSHRRLRNSSTVRGWAAPHDARLTNPRRAPAFRLYTAHQTNRGLFMPEQLLPTTVVGSYPQPEWLVDFKVLKSQTVPRVRVKEMWRVPEPYLEQ